MSKKELQDNINVALEPYLRWSSISRDEQEGYNADEDEDNEVSKVSNENGVADDKKRDEL